MKWLSLLVLLAPLLEAKYTHKDGYIFSSIKNDVIFETPFKAVGTLKMPFKAMIPRMTASAIQFEEKVYPHDLIRHVPYEEIMRNYKIKENVMLICNSIQVPQGFTFEESSVTFLNDDVFVSSVAFLDFPSNLGNDTIARQQFINFLFHDETRNDVEMVEVLASLGFNEYIRSLAPEDVPAFEYSLVFGKPVCDNDLNVYASFVVTFGAKQDIVEGHLVPYFTPDFKFLIAPKLDTIYWLNEKSYVNFDVCQVDVHGNNYCPEAAKTQSACGPTSIEQCRIDVYKVEGRFVWSDEALLDPVLVATTEPQIYIQSDGESTEVELESKIFIAEVTKGEAILVGDKLFVGVGDACKIEYLENTKDVKLSADFMKRFEAESVVKNVRLDDVVAKKPKTCPFWCFFNACCY